MLTKSGILRIAPHNCSNPFSLRQSSVISVYNLTDCSPNLDQTGKLRTICSHITSAEPRLPRLGRNHVGKVFALPMAAQVHFCLGVQWFHGGRRTAVSGHWLDPSACVCFLCFPKELLIPV